jgi:hypothetical protein
MGSKGPRWYDWQRLVLSSPSLPGWKRWLLVKRRLSDPRELSAYLVVAPADSSLAKQVRVADMRWTVAESLQTAKGEVGLDHYEVRNWTGWYRHITLAMWAQAFLAVTRKETGAELTPQKGLSKLAASSVAAFKAGAFELRRDSSAVLAIGCGCSAHGRFAAALVALATLAPGLGSLLPLSTALWCDLRVPFTQDSSATSSAVGLAGATLEPFRTVTVPRETPWAPL